MLRISTRSPLGTTSPASSAHNMTLLLRRSRPVRCLLMACLSVAAGWLMLTLLLPCLSVGDTAHLLLAHLPASDTPPLLFWIRLCAARFPFWLLIAAAGFTRFSGGLTSAVTMYRGLCDGAVMGLFASVASGHMSVLPQGYAGHRLLIAFSVWAIADLSIRLIMTLAARQVAEAEWESREENGLLSPAAQSALWRYLTVCLGGLCATLASCGIYTACLYLG